MKEKKHITILITIISLLVAFYLGTQLIWLASDYNYKATMNPVKDIKLWEMKSGAANNK